MKRVLTPLARAFSIMAGSMYFAPQLSANPSFLQGAAYIGGSVVQSYSTSYVMAIANGMSASDARSAAINSAKNSFVITSLEVSALMMRAEMVAQSKLDGRNASGDSLGVRGDNFKGAGGRVLEGCPTAACGSPSLLGGHQGQQGMFLGMKYDSGSLIDWMLESYAGTHDFLNNPWWYNSLGQAKNLAGLRYAFSEYVMNYTVNVALATPFAMATMVGPYTASVLTNDLLNNGQ